MDETVPVLNVNIWFSFTGVFNWCSICKAWSSGLTYMFACYCCSESLCS